MFKDNHRFGRAAMLAALIVTESFLMMRVSPPVSRRESPAVETPSRPKIAPDQKPMVAPTDDANEE